jgi:O-antigen/teichoic acid export membrane protein
MGRMAVARVGLTINQRGVLSIVAGTAGGQMLGLIAAPLLSRLYSPEQFGVFAVISALAVTMGTIAALRFELAIPLPESERDAYSLATLGLVAAALTAIAGTLGVLVAGDAIAAAFGQPALMPWLWVVPSIGAVMATFMVFNQLAIRQRRYGAIGLRNLLQSVTTALTQTIAGAVGPRSGGMILGLGVGQAVGLLSLVQSAGLGSVDARAGRSRRYVLTTASRYRRFPLLLVPSGLLNVLGLQLPVLLMAYWYGSQVAGWLGLTQRVLALPLSLIGAAVAQVYLAELSRAARADTRRARALFLKASKNLAVIGAAGSLVVLVLGPKAFSVLFGEKWESSGSYAQAMAIAMAAQLVAAPLSQTLIVFGRQVLQLIWDVSRALIVTGAVVLSALAGASAATAIWSVGVSSTTMYAASWLMSLRELRARARTTTQVPQRQLTTGADVG